MPEEILRDLNIVPIESMDEVLRHSLLCSDLEHILSPQDASAPLCQAILKDELHCLAKQ